MVADPTQATVLLVDDEVMLHEMLGRMLSIRYNVVSAYTVKEALEKMGERLPDVVCTDLMMPILSGIDLIKIMKENERLKDIPIVVISATAYEKTLRDAEDLGIFTALAKPFGRIDLLNTIEAALGGRNGS